MQFFETVSVGCQFMPMAEYDYFEEQEKIKCPAVSYTNIDGTKDTTYTSPGRAGMTTVEFYKHQMQTGARLI